MKKNSIKANGKLTVNQETIRRLSDLNMRAVNGGYQSGHLTCDSSFCGTSENTNCSEITACTSN
jgi:hypothetical protein